MDPEARARLDETMAQIADQTGAALYVYHHSGHAARRVVLRDTRNDRGTQFEAAQLDDDGTLRVTGHHTGPGVSEFFGDMITSYDWAYVIAPTGLGPCSPCWAAMLATMCSTCWPPITTSTAGRLTIFCEALKSPLRSAIGIANIHQLRAAASIPVELLRKLPLSRDCGCSIGLRTLPGRVTASTEEFTQAVLRHCGHVKAVSADGRGHR
jgi:hypothetical protein